LHRGPDLVTMRDTLFGPSREAGSEDVTEVWARCPDCQEERAFSPRAVEVPGYDAADTDPLLQDAVAGEPVLACPVCGRLEPDLVLRRGYDYELRDTGYEVGQWRDEEVGDDEAAAPPIPTEWDEETAMEPRGRGVHFDRYALKQAGISPAQSGATETPPETPTALPAGRPGPARRSPRSKRRGTENKQGDYPRHADDVGS